MIEAFDVFLSLFSSFGYFGDEENQKVLDNVGRSLKRGGALLLDLRNSRKGLAGEGELPVAVSLVALEAAVVETEVAVDRLIARRRFHRGGGEPDASA